MPSERLRKRFELWTAVVEEFRQELGFAIRLERRGGVDDGAAVRAGSKMREDVGAFAVEKRVLGKGGEEIGIGVKTAGTKIGWLTLSQVSAHRAGVYLLPGCALHRADPSLL
jgi:hypothetical protein